MERIIRYFLLAAIAALTLTLSLTLHGQEVVKWYTWEEGMTKAAEEPEKKFVIDMYTDWCGWCKKMDKVTFQHPVISEYINRNYIAIKFNAEQKEELDFKGQTFKFKKGGRRGYHELAAALTNGRLSYPTVVFLDEKQELIQAIPGFLDAAKFDPIIRYFSEDLHKEMPWATYLNDYNNNKAPNQQPDHTRLVRGN